MIQSIRSEWGFNADGSPIRRHHYLATDEAILPEDAATGSRALFENGEMALKTPCGWVKEGTA